MDKQEVNNFFRTGILIRLYTDGLLKGKYQYGLTIKLEDEFLIIFSNGEVLRNVSPYNSQIERVCATYIVSEKLTA